MAPGMLGEVVTPHESLLTQRTAELLLASVGPVVAGQLVRARELFKAVWPRAGEGPFTCMHSVMGFKMGGFSIDFPTATVGALVPLFGGVFPLRSHSRVEEGERAGRAARILSLLRAVGRTRPRFGGHVAVGSYILIGTLQTVAAHRGGLDGSVFVQVQQALGDGDQCAIILPGVPGSPCSLVTSRSGSRSRSASGAPRAPAQRRGWRWKPDTGQPRSPCRRPRTWCGRRQPGRCGQT